MPAKACLHGNSGEIGLGGSLGRTFSVAGAFQWGDSTIQFRHMIKRAILSIFAGACISVLQAEMPSVSDFEKAAMVLRQSAILKVMPEVVTPSNFRSGFNRFPWKRNIVTTVFWVGERPTARNPVPNYKSSWDSRWAANYGGFDNPDPGGRKTV